MLYCDKCGVSITGNPDFCPLCQGTLSGNAESGSSFPKIKAKKDYFSFALKIAAMASVTAICICIAIDYSKTDSFAGWWLYVAGGILSFWLSFWSALRRRKNIAKSIMFTTFMACLIVFLWDLFTGYKGWAIDYFLPISCCSAMLAMAVTAKVLNLKIEQYIYYLILDIVFGIIPLILILCGVVRFKILCIACVAVSIISLAALLIFQGKALRAEIIRRTHL